VAQRSGTEASGAVLVVDNDEGFRRSVASLLRHDGYRVSEAEDNESALQILGEQDIALLVLDLGLPSGEGLQLLDQITDPPPVLLTSGSGVVQFEDPRVSVFLAKPCPPPQLLEVVANLISSTTSSTPRARKKPPGAQEEPGPDPETR